MRNPFLDDFHELVITYRHSVLAALRTSVDTGTKQYEDRNATEQSGTYICGQLYIVSVQNRDGDLAEFLAHDIQSFPHSLSNCGKFHLPSTESDLLRAAWATRATFDSRLQNHGSCRYRTLSVNKRQYFPCICRRDINSLPGEPAAECDEVGCCIRHRHPGQFE